MIQEDHSKHRIDTKGSEEKQKSKKNQVSPEIPDEDKDQKKEEEEQEPQVPFCSMFRFATGLDYFLMVLGSIGAVGVGAAMPAFAYIWGLMTDSFNDSSIVDASRQTMFYFFYLGAGIFVGGWLMYGCWMIAGERQAIACRKAYLKALLQQQIGWFDLVNQTELASKFAADTISFQYGVGEKIGTLMMPIATLISGFVFAFVTGWLMTLVILSTLPALAIAGGVYVSIISGNQEAQEKSYSKAGGRAQQALSSIKTVKQLCGQKYESQLYQSCLNESHSQVVPASIKAGAGIGLIFLVMLASYALGFWYGSKCIIAADNCPIEIIVDRYTPGEVLVVFFSVLMAGFNLTNLGPSLEKISQGRSAAVRIFEILDRQPKIKSPPNAKKLDKIHGKITFENVTFAYPKEENKKILQNINLQFDIRKSALVGESGSGKSTVLQLIMRFYDPDEGKITLDGVDIKELDLRWLRQNIGYVGQEPVLFATTIKQNMLFGKDDATDEEIKQALKKAEAWDFIQELEDKLDTFVGMGGGQISGGQKQRIAIARALLKNPQIMLFDEATSALDRRNERLIQGTLDDVANNRTSITVAHRVRTIMHSDIIYVLNKGTIEESGRFQDLKKYKGQKMEQEQMIVKDKEKSEQSVKKQNNDEPEQTKEEKQKKQQEQLLKKYEDSIFGRLFAYSSDKCCLFVVGIFFAMANGTIFPIFSLFFARLLNVLLQLYLNPTDQTKIDEADLYALLFLVLAIASFICSLGQISIFTIIGQSITIKLRSEVFSKILKMPVPWFDIPKNNSGSLAARLFTECNQVNALTTTAIAIMLQNISSLITGIVIAFVFDWRTSLVALGMIPLLMLAGLLEMQFNTGQNQATDEAYKDSASLIMESMINIRTVSSSGHDFIITKKYDEKLKQPESILVRKGLVTGLIFGLSQLITYFIMGILFFIGAVFVSQNQDVTVEDMFTAVYALVFAAMSAGNNAHFMPDAAAANNAAANLFQILDAEDEQQIQIRQDSKMLTEGINGDISINQISFKYESRSEEIFNKFSLKIKYGTKVAFVGASGCGKSTIIQMLQRFYFPTQGSITINGNNIQDYDIHYLRKSFGVVSQEPVLFYGTFRQNIKYNLQSATDDDIVSAARQANALSFITGDEKINKDEDQEEGKGFDKNVGVKGSHISGGQKQRVAIARAILRNPEKLLLDEATSALDSANEKKVQESLDEIMKGKTSISIAHRIDTIKNSEKIYVFVKGKILEEGSYNELVSKRGYFYNLERGTQFI